MLEGARGRWWKIRPCSNQKPFFNIPGFLAKKNVYCRTKRVKNLKLLAYYLSGYCFFTVVKSNKTTNNDDNEHATHRHNTIIFFLLQNVPPPQKYSEYVRQGRKIETTEVGAKKYVNLHVYKGANWVIKMFRRCKCKWSLVGIENGLSTRYVKIFGIHLNTIN